MDLAPGFWDGVLRRLESVLDSWQVEAWVRPLRVESDAEGLRVVCPTNFHRDRLRDRCLELIERGVAEEAGRPLPVRVEVGTVAAPPPAAAAPAAAATPARPPALRALPSRRQPRQHPLPHTFESFVVGPCNALAREAGFAVAHGRQPRANPLFITSAVGLGKTHLARAIATEARAHGCERVLCVSAEGFTNAFTRAVRSRDTDRFKRRFRRGCELLVIDDVQFLKAKEATQLELFHTLCHLLDVGARVVFTGDRMPRDIDGLAPRLRSQLGAGLVAELEVPDAPVRRRILRSKAAAGGVRLPADCLDLLVESIQGSVRDLEGALVQLVESAALLQQDIDLELTRTAIHKVTPMRPERQRLGIEDVIRVVCAFFSTPRETLCMRSKARAVVRRRQIAMYLCRQYTDASASEIATAFRRKHPSVTNAVRTVEQGILERAPLRYQVEALVARIGEGRGGA